MRKSLATIALFIVMIGTFAPVSFSLSENLNQSKSFITAGLQVAQADNCPVGQTTIQDKDANGNVIGSYCGTPGDDDNDTPGCGTLEVGCWIVSGLVEYILLPIPSFIASLFGITSDLFLSFAINPVVYGTCPATGCDQIANSIRSAWGIVRDFANIGFIFALFVAAFMLILDKTSVGGKQFEPKKVVARVIIMALLVNFSLFFCRMIIQTADIFSHLLYNRIDATTEGSSTGVLANALRSVGIKSPSLALVAKVNPQEILTNKDMKASGGLTTYVIISVISFFLYFVFIFMFAQMLFIFAGRIFALWIGMIMAPFAFVSYAIPFLEDNPYIGFENWLKNFVKLAFMIPLYLFFLYLTIKVLDLNVGAATLNSIKDLETNGNWVTKTVYMVISKLTPLFGAIFMLMYGKKWAVEMSGVVGEMAGKISGAVTGVAMGAVTGGVAFAGRQTFGALGSKLAAGTADSTSTFGKGLNTLGKGLSTSTFDVRNSTMFNKGMGYAGSATGQKMDIGSNGLQEKGGYAATGGIKQILQDRKDRIADEKATKEEQAAIERANNPQSPENIKKRNAERALKQAQDAKAAEESKIAAEAENTLINTSEQEAELQGKISSANADIATNNARMADIDTQLAGKQLMTDADEKANQDAKVLAEANLKDIERKLAENSQKGQRMGTTQAQQDEIAQEKADLERQKADEQTKIDNANKAAAEQQNIKNMAAEKVTLENLNKKKAEEITNNQNKLNSLANISGKTPAQLKDEARRKEAEAAGSPEKLKLDKATKNADEEAKKVAELQTKIKEAEKNRDTKLAEELKKELNGDNWDQIEGLEEKLKRTQDKGERTILRNQINELTGGKQSKLNQLRSDVFSAKNDYQKKHGDYIKSLNDSAKESEKKYKESQQGRVDVLTERENKLNIDLVNATIDVDNIRKGILNAHANALNNVGAKVEGHAMYSIPANAAKTVTAKVAPIVAVITNGRVGAGYVDNNNAYNAAANTIRNNAQTNGSSKI